MRARLLRSTVVAVAFGGGLVWLPVHSTLVSAQTAPPPQVPPPAVQQTRDARVTRVGTASLAGRVTDAEGRPVRRAVLRLNSSLLREGVATLTDGEGHYAFAGLAAGQYEVSASKNGFLASRLGAKSLTAPGTAVTLAAGQAVDDANLSMVPGCVITGFVYDASGEPAATVAITAMKSQMVNGIRQMVGAGPTRATDDRGRFRLFGLLPGDYYVAARGLGRVPVASTWDGGMMSVSATTLEAGTTYAPTFHPGTATPAEAQLVSCRLGPEPASITFSLAQVRTARVSGRVVDSQGRPVAGGSVMVSPATGPWTQVSTTGLRADGTFERTDVIPGDYVLAARAGSGVIERVALPDGRTVITVDGVDVGDSREARTPVETGLGSVSVAGVDVTGLLLQTQPGATVSGRIVPDAGLTFDFQPSRVSVTTTLIGMTSLASVLGTQTAAADSAGAFTLRGLVGPRVLRATAPGQWRVKAIRMAGRDVTDSAIDFKGSERITRVEIVLTNRVSTVSGKVLDEAGQECADYAVVVFADERARLGYPSRFIARGGPTAERRGFRIVGLPPGEYLAVAVPSLEPNDHTDVLLLDRLRPLATRLRLTEGDTRTIELRLATLAKTP